MANDGPGGGDINVQKGSRIGLLGVSADESAGKCEVWEANG